MLNLRKKSSRSKEQCLLLFLFFVLSLRPLKQKTSGYEVFGKSLCKYWKMTVD